VCGRSKTFPSTPQSAQRRRGPDVVVLFFAAGIMVTIVALMIVL
jgi:hypothetical protein